MSASKLEPCIPLPLDVQELEDIIDKAKDWAIMHGAAMRSKTQTTKDSIQFAPFILTPSTFPRCEFDKAVRLQSVLNELMHRVAHDDEFLTDSLRGTVKVDGFTGHLFEIYEQIKREGFAQPLSLGLLRSDLMLESRCYNSKKSCKNSTYCCWKQVEINTIASGFGHLGPASAALQSYILQELGHADKLKNLPENNALTGLCSAMLEAWKICGNSSAAIMFVVENVTYNICDQRFHEFELRRLNPNIKVIRKTLTEIYKLGKLGKNKDLLIDGLTVTVVYFRAGYEPGHYPTENEWNARILMEQSMAIKCPSINYQLAGTKKVQQALAKPGVLNRFLNDSTVVYYFTSCF